MSRAAVKAKQKQKALDREFEELEFLFAKAEQDSAADAILFQCERCGLEQTSNEICVLCGYYIARFVDWLPGSHMIRRTSSMEE